MPVPSWHWRTGRPQLPLRRFEFLLLQALGYAVDFEYAADDGLPIDPTLPPTASSGSSALSFASGRRIPVPPGFLGAHLLAFSPRGVLTRLPLLQAGQAVSADWRCSPILGKRQLKSRELF